MSRIAKSRRNRGDNDCKRQDRPHFCCNRLGTIKYYSCVMLLLLSFLCCESHGAFSSGCLSIGSMQKQHQRCDTVPSMTILNSSPTSTKVSGTRNAGNKNRKNSQKKHKLKKNKKEKKVPISSIVIREEKQLKEKRKEQQLGAILAFCIVCQLAFRFESGSDDMMMLSPNWDATMANVLDATLATDSTQLFAGVVAELISGVTGSIAAVCIQSLIFTSFWREDNNNDNNSDNNSKITQSSDGTTTAEGKEQIDLKNEMKISRSPPSKDLFDKADDGYFIANSASRPLLEAAGVPRTMVSFSNVIFEAVQPSELVKLGSRGRQRRIEEEQNNIEQLSSEERTNNNDAGGSRSIDVVEIFADVTKWLEYNVLRTEFGETMAMGENMLGPTSTGAVFGVFAALSTQLYADVLYGYFRYGPESRYTEVQSRTELDWFSIYALRAVSSAVLFGVYESCQGPVTQWIQGTLAGGIDGCVGSNNFDMCMQTYIDDNAPGASPEAQARALATNLLMVAQRIQDVAGDTSVADFEALSRAWTVSFLSFIHNNFI